MKLISHFTIFTLSAFILLGCGSRTGENSRSVAETDTTSVPDTGYTGIKQFMSGQYIISEVTFKNGVRQGLTKTFYKSGRLMRTFWYVNGLRQDSSCWYYEEGQVFRTTQYRNDTIEGIQRQYYRTGQLKARLGYTKGFRTLYFQEFTREGKLITDYPDIKISTVDNYKAKGTYRIILEPTRKADVRFFRGEMVNGAYDTSKFKKIPVRNNAGYIDLKKTGSQKSSSVGVMAEILTDFANRRLVYKKIDLPYNDLQ